MLYNWEAIVNILPYLTLSDILSSATISKEWNYYLTLYIKKVLLTPSQSDLHSNPFKVLKMLYHRKIQLWTPEKTKECKFPDIPSQITVGNVATVISTLDGKKYLGLTSRLSSYSKKNWVNLAMKVKASNIVECVGNYLYICEDSTITRYNPRDVN